MVFFSETHRHTGHIVLRNNFYNSLKIKQLYISLCVLCAYVFQKKLQLDHVIFYSLLILLIYLIYCAKNHLKHPNLPQNLDCCL
jgi:hypothetical protein